MRIKWKKACTHIVQVLAQEMLIITIFSSLIKWKMLSKVLKEFFKFNVASFLEILSVC